MKQMNPKGHILFEIIVSLAITTIMITMFTTEFVRLNQSIQLRRERYKMETQLMSHVLAYEREDHPLIVNNETQIEYDTYRLFLVDHEICIEWEVYSGETKRVCNEVNLASTKWIYAI